MTQEQRTAILNAEGLLRVLEAIVDVLEDGPIHKDMIIVDGARYEINKAKCGRK